jgi:hypothetical protein
MTQKDRRRVLRAYLRQYSVAAKRMQELEHRLAIIDASRTEQTAVSIDYHFDELREHIENQRNACAKALLAVAEVLDTLPAASEPRIILEKHYVDGLSWKQIQKDTFYSRSHSSLLEMQGLDLLLENGWVGQRLERYISETEKKEGENRGDL